MKYNSTMTKNVCLLLRDSKESLPILCQKLKLDPKEVKVWRALFNKYGETVFDDDTHIYNYDRRKLVEEHFASGRSLTETCVKYKIFNRYTLRNWIAAYKSTHKKQS